MSGYLGEEPRDLGGGSTVAGQSRTDVAWLIQLAREGIRLHARNRGNPPICGECLQWAPCETRARFEELDRRLVALAKLLGDWG